MWILRAILAVLILELSIQTITAAPPPRPSEGAAIDQQATAEVTRRATLALFALTRADGKAALVELDAALAMPGLANVPEVMRFQVLSLKGRAELTLGDPEAAYRSLLGAAELAPARRDITYWVTLATVTMQLGKLEEGIEAALVLVRDYPDESISWDRPVSTAVITSRRLAAASPRRELLERLWRMEFGSSRSPVAEWVLRELLAIYAEQGEDELSLRLMAQLKQPESLAMLRFDGRFARFAASSKLGGYALAQDRAIDRARQQIAKHPRELEAINDLVELLYRAGKLQEALALLDDAVARAEAGRTGRPVFDDIDENLAWVQNWRSRTLMKLGRWDETVLAQRAAVEAEAAGGGERVGQVINMALTFYMLERPDEALRALEQLEYEAASPYGWMGASEVKVCAYRQLDDLANAQLALDFMLEHAADGYPSLKYALLCMDDQDELAKRMIAMLDDPATRVDLLQDVQTYLPSPYQTRFDRLLDERFAAVKARADVKAAVARYGKILSWPAFAAPW